VGLCFLEAEPAEFVAAFAQDVHASAVFLHDCLARRAGFRVQEHPFVGVFVGAATPRIPDLKHVAVNRLVTVFLATEAEAGKAVPASRIKNFDLLVRFQLSDHLAPATCAPVGSFLEFDI